MDEVPDDGFLLENLMNKSSDSIYFKDRQSRFIMVNQACANKYNRASPEFVLEKTNGYSMMRGVLIALLMIVSLAQGGLEWEQKEIAVEVHATQLSADALFRFTNTGEEPILFSSLKPGCGCLTPSLSKRTCPPGESGELIVRFNLRDRTGKQRKSMVVNTDDGASVSLYTNTDIPTAYTIVPKLIKWAADGSETNKVAILSNPNKEPIRLLTVTSSHKGLPAELKTVREGFEYKVVMIRQSDEKNMRSVIRITTEPAPGKKTSKTLKLYVHAP